MGRTACIELLCLYKGNLYLYLFYYDNDNDNNNNNNLFVE